MFRRLKELFGNLVIYGLGDTATQIISVLLLPLYARYLSTTDYGVLALLLTVEMVTKVVFRWGIDGAFMRLYFDCPDQPARQRLASTQFYFLLTANGALLALGPRRRSWLAPYLFKTDQYNWTMRLVLINTFVVSFYYLPFHVMRIEGKTPTFISLTFARQPGDDPDAAAARDLASVGRSRRRALRYRRHEHLHDRARAVVRAAHPACLLESLLRESLRFGLPRLPHGVAQQVIGSSDRYVLARYVALNQVGLYSTGSTFGQGLKLFLSSFEQAWAPFYFGVMREPDAKTTFARVTTYSVLILAVLVAGLAACAHDLVSFLMPPAFLPAAQIVPWVGLGVGLQGLYLLTSIGLNITKRTGTTRSRPRLPPPPASARTWRSSRPSGSSARPGRMRLRTACWRCLVAFLEPLLSDCLRNRAAGSDRHRRGDFVGRRPAARAVASPFAWPACSRHCGGDRLLARCSSCHVSSSDMRSRKSCGSCLGCDDERSSSLPSDATELAGEIVTTPTTDLAVEVEPSDKE